MERKKCCKKDSGHVAHPSYDGLNAAEHWEGLEARAMFESGERAQARALASKQIPAYACRPASSIKMYHSSESVAGCEERCQMFNETLWFHDISHVLYTGSRFLSVCPKSRSAVENQELVTVPR